MSPLLSVEHLSISFIQYDRGTRRRILPAIRDLDLTIDRGQVAAVVGSSGSGKSLLAHGILGILPYNAHMEGSITYDGAPLTPNGPPPSVGERSYWCPSRWGIWTHS